MSHTPRGLQWELQPSRCSAHPSDAQEHVSDTDPREFSSLGLVFEAFITEGGWPSQSHSPSHEPTPSHPTWSRQPTARAGHTAALSQHRCWSRSRSTRNMQFYLYTEAGEMPRGGPSDMLRGISVQTQHADWLVTEA